jgi:hypothetical protein
VSDFVEECRREWKRLRVPARPAEEMADDLAADLREAEADGAFPEEVLGDGDPGAVTKITVPLPSRLPAHFTIRVHTRPVPGERNRSNNSAAWKISLRP